MMLQNKIIILNPYFFLCAHLFIRRSIIYPNSGMAYPYIVDLDATMWFCTDISRFVLFLPFSLLLFLPAASFLLPHIRESGQREDPNYYSGESLYSDYFQSADDRWRFMWSWSQLTRLLGWLLALLTGWLKC